MAYSEKQQKAIKAAFLASLTALKLHRQIAEIFGSKVERNEIEILTEAALEACSNYPIDEIVLDGIIERMETLSKNA